MTTKSSIERAGAVAVGDTPRLRRDSPRWPLRALSGLVDMAM